jgi:SAM-dependent methyltransferase
MAAVTRISRFGIAFDRAGSVPGARPCPVCRSRAADALLTVAETPFRSGTLPLVRCQSCGSAWFDDPDPVIGYDAEGFEATYWLNYVQNGAGISAMIEPLLAVGRPRRGRLLDVGCGFGFVPHFWQSCGFGPAIGLESTVYGAAGAERLGVRIIPRHYAEAAELHGEAFDYVYSGEVLEHVEDPAAFLAEVTAALAEDGILVLTTPSASILRADAPAMEVLAALSPGFHYFVASRRGLEALVRGCGLPHVLVRDLGHRLVVWASRRSLPPIREGFDDWPLYLDYLEGLSANPDPHVAGGALFRLVKDGFNLGRFDVAERAYPRFAGLAHAQYGIDFHDIAASAAWRRRRHRGDGATHPSWMGCGLYYAGRMEGRLGAPPVRRQALFAAAIETMHAEIALFAQFAGEAEHFLPFARRGHAEATAALAAATPGLPDPNQAYVLQHPGEIAGRDLCLMAIYAPDGRVTAASASYVDLLARHGCTVVACLAVEDATAEVDLGPLADAAGIVVRRNGGMDFACWAAALRLMPEAWGARRLVFTNDSVTPLPDLFGAFAARLRAETADYVALTESHQVRHHTQSFFFLFQGAALAEPRLRAFWTGLPMLTRKRDVIEDYEVGMLARVTEDWGLSASILYPFETLFPGVPLEMLEPINVCHAYWEHLVHSGMPFVKIELLRDNPERMNILHWRALLARHGADPDRVAAHMAVRRATPLQPEPGSEQPGAAPTPAPVIDRRPEWRIILSELNRVRLNARRRQRARTATASPST